MSKEATSKKTGRDVTPADLTELIQKRAMGQYVVYEVEMLIRDAIVGGVAKRLEMTFAQIDTRTKKGILTEAERIKQETVARYEEMAASLRKKEAEEKGEELEETIHPELSAASKEAVEARWVTFWQDEVGLYLEPRTIKAAIRECHSTLGTFTKGRQQRKKSGHNDGTYVEAIGERKDRVYLMRKNRPITEPDTFEDRVVLLKTAQGPKSALKRIDVVYGDERSVFNEQGHAVEDYACHINFRIKVLQESSITEQDLVNALALMQDRGVGAMASLGFGKTEITKFERVGTA